MGGGLDVIFDVATYFYAISRFNFFVETQASPHPSFRLIKIGQTHFFDFRRFLGILSFGRFF
jgi:hypothetical protein